MTTALIVRYLHFVSIFGLVAVVVGQHLLLGKTMTRAQICRVRKLDMVYAISAVLVLATGFIQWFWVGKPAVVFTKNWIFHLKITTFLIVGLLSIYPTVFFGRNRKGDPDESVALPGGVIWCVRIELLLLFLIPLLATLMAHGIGQMGG